MEMLFSPLPEPNLRWKAFLTSWSFEALALLFIMYFSVLFPPTFVRPQSYMITTLVPYQPPVPHGPQPVAPRLVPKQVELPKPKLEAALKLPPLPKPKRLDPEVKAPEVKSAPERPPELAPGNNLPKVVVTNSFSTGSSAMPTTNRPASQVQTGGFGDPNGVPARPTNGHAVNINAFGSWDLPSGAGRGNGTGGAKGVSGIVTSAGFGNGVAVGSPKGGGGGTVRQAGFGNAKPSADTPQRKAAPEEPPTTPVEIVQKPKPDYTAEGRALKIEGEVRLEVLFTASGEVRVIRVVQGLGHGLDEQAVRAAEKIKFKPAQRQGQPVDSTATLHIIFQLA